MLHPSYTDLMEVVNREVEPGEEKVVNSRYSIVLATAKRARQIIDGAETMVETNCPKPLSYAIEELHQGKIRVLGDDEEIEEVIEEETEEETEAVEEQADVIAEAEETIIEE